MRNLFGFATRSGRRLGVNWKEAPKPPPAPDYRLAAQQTAANQAAALRQQTNANRINQVTPYGSLSYTHSGSDPDSGWTQNMQLSPAQQKLLDAQNKTSLQMSGLQDQAAGYVRDAMGRSISMDDLPASMVNPGQTGQDALMARMRPELQMQRDRSENQLANQGIQLGSEAWINAQRNLNQKDNDAVSEAARYGIGIGQDAQSHSFGLQSAIQDRPFTMLNSLRNGAQVTNPNFASFAQQGQANGADMLGAAGAQGQYDQGVYNGQVGAYNANGGWLGPIGSSAVDLGAAFLNSGRGKFKLPWEK